MNSSNSLFAAQTPQPGDPDFVGPVYSPRTPQPGDPDFVGPIAPSPGDSPLPADQYTVGPIEIPDDYGADPLPQAPHITIDNTYLEKVPVLRDIAAAWWWVFGLVLVIAFVWAAIRWGLAARRGNPKDSIGPVVVLGAAVGIGGLWTLIRWSTSL